MAQIDDLLIMEAVVTEECSHAPEIGTIGSLVRVRGELFEVSHGQINNGSARIDLMKVENRWVTPQQSDAMKRPLCRVRNSTVDQWQTAAELVHVDHIKAGPPFFVRVGLSEYDWFTYCEIMLVK